VAGGDQVMVSFPDASVGPVVINVQGPAGLGPQYIEIGTRDGWVDRGRDHACSRR